MPRSATILLCALCCQALVGAAEVVGLTLIDAASDLPVAGHAPIADGASIDLAVVGTALNIRADVDGGTPGSVTFTLGGAENDSQTESVAPYALKGDSSGDYAAWTPTVGAYTLSAVTDGGTAYSIGFSVVDSSGGGGGGGSGGGGGDDAAFIESGGLVVMEYENASYADLGDWGSVGTAHGGYTGAGYLEWKTGDDSGSIDSAGQGELVWTMTIATTGSYQLHMRSWPSHNTEHNDVWIDFPDAQHYRRKSGTNTDLSGWTKMYNNGGGKWGWQTSTKDHDAHDIWVDFPSPGTYTFRCSGRSTKFAVDRIVLRHSSVAESTAKDTSLAESARSGPVDGDGSVTIGGELKQWHRVDLQQRAIASSELADPNPFRDYRFNVTFTAPSGAEYVVPGYFATDGAGGDAGNVWMAHLNPSETGTWTYAISFRSGTDVAVDLAPNAGSPVAPFDGKTGSFTVAASDKSGDDFRAGDQGMLVNTGAHYLTYRGSGRPFLYTGPGIPENILGYRGFTNTTVGVGHEFTVHEADWQSGDPDWGSGDGRALIGALNYIAEQGANCLYMMSNTIGGDGKDCFPHPTPDTTKDRYDLLKLIQWDIALAHAQAQGIFLHWHLSEHERGNREYYGGTASGGSMTVERKLYFRMLNAVFGHYNALKWNLAEEIEWVAAERTAQMAYIKAIDPYDHPVTYQVGGAGLPYNTYDDHLGDPNIDAGSFQGGASRSNMFNTIQSWRSKSAAAGEPWACAWDEPQKIENDNTDEVDGYPMGRRDKMWPCLMAGGDGFMWYIQKDGGGHGFDQRIEDFTIMQNAFNWSGHIRDFLEPLPLLDLRASMDLVDSTTGTDYCLHQEGVVYAIYNDRAGSGMSLDLTGVSGSFSVRWFDPRNGGGLQTGSITSVAGGGPVDLGAAPSATGQDWAVLVSLIADPSNQDPVIDAGPSASPATVTGTTTSLSVTASDPDGDPLDYSWSATTVPAGASPQVGAGAAPSVAFDAAGTYVFTVVVDDGRGGSASGSVTVGVAQTASGLDID